MYPEIPGRIRIADSQTIAIWIMVIGFPALAAEPLPPGRSSAGEESDLPAAVHALGGTNASMRLQAISDLGKHGNEGLPHLLRILAPANAVDHDRIARWITMLGSDDYPTRETATRALMEDPEGAYTELRKASRHADPEVRHRVALILRHRNQTRTPYPDPDKCAALRAMAQIGPGASNAVPLLCSLLGSEDSQIRRLSCEVLHQIGAQSSPAVPELMEALRDENPDCRRTAAWALGAIGHEAAGAVPHLAQASNDPVAEVGDAAVEALGLLGTDSRQTIPMLLQRFDLVRGNSWVTTASSLAKLGDRSCLPRILRKLKDSDRQEQDLACRAVAAYGRDAKEAIPLLIPLAKSCEATPAYSAMHALRAIGGAALPPLLEELKAEKSAGRIGETLCGFEKDSEYRRVVMPYMIARFQQDGVNLNTYVHSALCQMLAEAGFTDAMKPVSDNLVGTLTDHENINFFQQNIDFAFQNSTNRPQMIAILRAGMRTAETRDWAAMTLLRMDRSEAPRVLPLLLDILEREKNNSAKWNIKEAALWALTWCGDAAGMAGPLVTFYAKTGPHNYSVRLTAIRVLPSVLPPEVGIPLLESIRREANPDGSRFLTDAVSQALDGYATRARREKSQNQKPFPGE